MWRPSRRSRRGLRVGCLALLMLGLGAAAAAFLLLPGWGVQLPEPIAGWLGDEPLPVEPETAPVAADEDESGPAPLASAAVETTVADVSDEDEQGSGLADIPTVTPFPTRTPKPDPTLRPTVVPEPLAPLSFPVLSPATPTAPAEPFALAGETGVNLINQAWEQDGVSLTARTVDIRSAADGDAAAARVWFRLVNKTGERILIEIDWNNIHLEDSFGTRYVDYYGGGTTSQWIEPGENFDFDRYYTTIIEQPSRVPADAAFVQVVVDAFSRVRNARWQYDINPALSPISPPPAGETKAVGEVWENGGVTLQLADLQLHDDSGGEAAARAWFVLTNSTNQAVLVDIDFGRIYLLDSFGRRFGDWEGGGLFTQTIEPGRTVEFNRYYSDMSGWISRITRGASFVTLVVDNTAGQNAALWTLPIDSRLSGAAGVPTEPLPINQPWEQDGISLTARTIEVRDQDSGDSAAARVWFRLVNKTGQRRLIVVDWSAIYLEDSLGTIYGDYYGKEMTSFRLDPGEIYNFDRYYSTIVEQESRIPPTSQFVDIVVDSFSQIKNARWRWNLNSKPMAMAASDADMTRAIGDGWEQDGVMLRLTSLEVYSESQGNDAAVRAWYEVVNTTNLPVLVEIDYGHLIMLDSFGGFFSDWEGGGVSTYWLGAGETQEFNRYYSEMSGRPSRITRGSEFVLAWFGNVAGIPTGMWRMDIAR